MNEWLGWSQEHVVGVFSSLICSTSRFVTPALDAHRVVLLSRQFRPAKTLQRCCNKMLKHSMHACNPGCSVMCIDAFAPRYGSKQNNPVVNLQNLDSIWNINIQITTYIHKKLNNWKPTLLQRNCEISNDSLALTTERCQIRRTSTIQLVILWTVKRRHRRWLCATCKDYFNYNEVFFRHQFLEQIIALHGRIESFAVIPADVFEVNELIISQKRCCKLKPTVKVCSKRHT